MQTKFCLMRADIDCVSRVGISLFRRWAVCSHTHLYVKGNHGEKMKPPIITHGCGALFKSAPPSCGIIVGFRYALRSIWWLRLHWLQIGTKPSATTTMTWLWKSTGISGTLHIVNNLYIREICGCLQPVMRLQIVKLLYIRQAVVGCHSDKLQRFRWLSCTWCSRVQVTTDLFLCEFSRVAVPHRNTPDICPDEHELGCRHV